MGSVPPSVLPMPTHAAPAPLPILALLMLRSAHAAMSLRLRSMPLACDVTSTDDAVGVRAGIVASWSIGDGYGVLTVPPVAALMCWTSMPSISFSCSTIESTRCGETMTRMPDIFIKIIPPGMADHGVQSAAISAQWSVA